jgi:hypothetical protein
MKRYLRDYAAGLLGLLSCSEPEAGCRTDVANMVMFV